MTLFILIVEDRHTDVEAIPFLSLAGAITEAKRRYPHGLREGSLTSGLYDAGWRYYADWSTEGETLRVVEHEVEP
jgi:hypothetical protein